MNRWSCAFLLVLGAVLMPRLAHGADPTKQECVAENDAAQDLRSTGKLVEAREKLSLCASASCPTLVRDDCAQRLTEIDRVTPSLIFEAGDGAGAALVAVSVTLDGRRVADKLDGAPIQVDPGEHHVVFETDGVPSVEKTVVVHEGDRGVHVHVVLAQAVTPVAPTAPPSAEVFPQRTVAIATGGAGVVGLVLGSVLGLTSKSKYDHALQTECGNNPNACSPQGIQDGQSAHGQATASTVAFVAGGALLGAGAVLWFTAPKAGVSVGTTVGAGGGRIVATGAW